VGTVFGSKRRGVGEEVVIESEREFCEQLKKGNSSGGVLGCMRMKISCFKVLYLIELKEKINAFNTLCVNL